MLALQRHLSDEYAIDPVRESEAHTVPSVGRIFYCTRRICTRNVAVSRILLEVKSGRLWPMACSFPGVCNVEGYSRSSV